MAYDRAAVETIFGQHAVRAMLDHRPQALRQLWLVGAPDATPKLLPLWQQATAAGIAAHWISRRELEAELGPVVHQGVAAELTPFAYTPFEDLLKRAQDTTQPPPLFVALDQVQDPHNVGALLRSALALGADGALVLKDRACEITAAVHKAAAGATAQLPIARVTNLARSLRAFKEQGVWIVGAAAETQQTIAEIDWTLPTVLVIGSEGQGLRRLTQELCDSLAAVPLGPNMPSLNASVAGAICLYEAARQRRQAAH